MTCLISKACLVVLVVVARLGDPEVTTKPPTPTLQEVRDATADTRKLRCSSRVNTLFKPVEVYESVSQDSLYDNAVEV